jgi:UDP-galactopyranose mutase
MADDKLKVFGHSLFHNLLSIFPQSSQRMKSTDSVLVVGAGFAGATIARELADAGISVRVIDRRSHLAGNAHDYRDKHGIWIHSYGPHIFHTSNMAVVDWLSRFTDWMEYKHRVKAMLGDGCLVTLPVNRETVARVGLENIVDTFIRPYSEKMWGLPLEELDPDILSRVPIRSDNNEYYFPNDAFQAMPTEGYTELIKRMLTHQFIEVQLETEFSPGCEKEFIHIFNSMPIDEYFNCSLGPLPYRSIKFHHVELPIPKLFPVPVVNFTHKLPYTRVTEWKNFPGNTNPAATVLTYEEPCSYLDNKNERYYPVKDISGVNRHLFKQYLSMTPKNMTFIGRCGLYAYLDMHQAVSSSLAVARTFIQNHQCSPNTSGTTR